MTQPLVTRESKKAAFPDMLEKNKGMITKTCKDMELQRSVYYWWRETDEKFAAKCDKVLTFTGDFVEDALLEKIDKGDTTAIIFYCKTKLKNRGYVERVEQTGKDGEPLSPIRITENDQAIMDRYIDREIEKRKYDGSRAGSAKPVH